MKKHFYFILLFVGGVAYAQTPCTNGSANGLECLDYDLMAQFTPSQMGAVEANDSWGWTDPADGKEYAIIGLDNGTAFFDITDPVNSVYLGKLQTHTSPSIWRDIKIYNNHAYIVSEAPGHGMQIFDLTRLRDVSSPPATFFIDAYYGEFGNCHNLVINEDSGFAYAVGTDLEQGGPHFIDLSNPTFPTAAGGYSLNNYTHDAQVVMYNGPDSDYTGREIFFGSNATQVVIVDVTDKANPSQIATINYSNVDYTHQGWLTEDQRYFIIGDEGDEQTFGFNTRTIVFDFQDLDNPDFHFEHEGETPAIDHNGYVVDDKFYLANYTAGMRVLDISNIASGSMSEIGFFDTFPSNNTPSFSGTWNVYPFFESGNIVISGSQGFTLVRQSGTLGTTSFDEASFGMIPNPAKDQLTISSPNTTISSIAIFNLIGQQIFTEIFSNTSSEILDVSNLESGIYLVTINKTSTKRLVVN